VTGYTDPLEHLRDELEAFRLSLLHVSQVRARAVMHVGAGEPHASSQVFLSENAESCRVPESHTIGTERSDGREVIAERIAATEIDLPLELLRLRADLSHLEAHLLAIVAAAELFDGYRRSMSLLGIVNQQAVSASALATAAASSDEARWAILRSLQPQGRLQRLGLLRSTTAGWLRASATVVAYLSGVETSALCAPLGDYVLPADSLFGAVPQIPWKEQDAGVLALSMGPYDSRSSVAAAVGTPLLWPHSEWAQGLDDASVAEFASLACITGCGIAVRGSPDHKGLLRLSRHLSHPVVALCDPADANAELSPPSVERRQAAWRRHVAMPGPYATCVMTELEAARVFGSDDPLDACSRLLERSLGEHCQVLSPSALSQVEHELLFPNVSLSVVDGLATGRVLITGPANSDRLLLASQLAEHLGRLAVVVPPSALVGSHIGDSERRIDDLLANAKRRNVVLVLDRINSLLQAGGAQAGPFTRLLREYALQRILDHPELIFVVADTPKELPPPLRERILVEVEAQSLTPSARASLVAAQLECMRIGDAPPADLASRQLTRMAIAEAARAAKMTATACHRSPTLDDFIRAVPGTLDTPTRFALDGHFPRF